MCVDLASSTAMTLCTSQPCLQTISTWLLYTICCESKKFLLHLFRSRRLLLLAKRRRPRPQSHSHSRIIPNIMSNCLPSCLLAALSYVLPTSATYMCSVYSVRLSSDTHFWHIARGLTIYAVYTIYAHQATRARHLTRTVEQNLICIITSCGWIAIYSMCTIYDWIAESGFVRSNLYLRRTI